MNRYIFLLIASLCLMGCAKSPLPKPQASDWAKRNLEGVSLESPYELTANTNPLPGWVNIASYKPAKTPHALEIRIDVLQQPAGNEAPSLDQFAQTVLSVSDEQTNALKSKKFTTIKIGDVDAIRSRSQSREKIFIDSLVFKKGKYFWLIEVFYTDESLSDEAKRVLDSVSIE